MKEKIYNFKKKLLYFYKNYFRLFLIIFSFLIFTIFFSVFIFNLFFKKTSVIFFDVGQGDSALIKTKDNKNILIDFGADKSVLKKLADHLSGNEIDLAVFSHLDVDHVGGVYYVLDNYKIKNILTGENILYVDSENADNLFLKKIQNKIIKKNNLNKDLEINFFCGDEIKIDNLGEAINIYTLSPRKDRLWKNDNNDNSLVMLLNINNFNFLFMGDASAGIENEVFDNIKKCFKQDEYFKILEYLKNITILKVSHHGSKTASQLSFLKKINPKYSIISVGKNNKYNHPAAEVVNNLKKAGSKIFSTADRGDVIFEIQKDILKIKLEK